MNLNEFNVNTTGIPKINYNSRQIVNRSLNRYKPPNAYKYGTSTHPSVPESPTPRSNAKQTEVVALPNDTALSGKSTYSYKSGPKDSLFGPWDHKVASSTPM